MRQLGVALQSFVAAKKTFPQGINVSSFSFQTMLLPYIEQKPLYDSINFSTGALPQQDLTGSNNTAMTRRVRTFICPTEPVIQGADAPINYAGNRGDGLLKYGFNGAFPLESQGPIGPEAFKDGLSTTAIVAEWVLGSPTHLDAIAEAKRITFETSQSYLKASDFERFVSDCRGLDAATAQVNPTLKGSNWMIGDLGNSLYNHSLNINQHSCTNGGGIQGGAWTSGSMHGLGANVLMADGHARFLKETISTDLWRAIGSRDGGEIFKGDY